MPHTVGFSEMVERDFLIELKSSEFDFQGERHRVVVKCGCIVHKTVCNQMFFFQFIQKSNKKPNTTIKLEKQTPADEVPQSVVQSHFLTLFNASIIAKLISLTQLLSTDLENIEHCSIPVFAAKQLFCKSGHIVSTHILAVRCSHNFTAYSQGGTVRSKILVRLRNLVIFEIFGVKFSAKKSMFQICFFGSPFGIVS